MTTTASEWLDFFVAAGIPSGPASNYAILFSENRINRKMLPDLTKEILKEIGITLVGDILAILKHAKEVYDKDMIKGLVSDKPNSMRGPSAKSRIGSTITDNTKSSDNETAMDIENNNNTTIAAVSNFFQPKIVRSAAEQAVKDTRNFKDKSIKRPATFTTGSAIKRSSAFNANTVKEGPAVVLRATSGKMAYTRSTRKPVDSTTAKIAHKLTLTKKLDNDSGSGKQSVFDRLGAADVQEKKIRTNVTADLTTSGSSSVFNRLGGLRQETDTQNTKVKGKRNPSEGLTVDVRKVKLGMGMKHTDTKMRSRLGLTKAEKVAIGKTYGSKPDASAFTRLGSDTGGVKRRFIIRK